MFEPRLCVSAARPQWTKARDVTVFCVRLSASGVNLRAEPGDPFQTSRDHPLASTPREINSMKINFISRSSRSSIGKSAFEWDCVGLPNERLRLGQSWFNFKGKTLFQLVDARVPRLVKRRCSINVLKLFLLQSMTAALEILFTACGRN